MTGYGQLSLPAVAPRNFDLHASLPTAMIDGLVGAVRDGSVTAVEVKHWGGAMANPGAIPADEMDEITVPDGLRYSANHMWLDVAADGLCHAGMDAFLSRALGPAERVSFVWQTGLRRATAVITVNGIDHDVVFPNPFLLTNCNLYLRTDPSPLTTDPYTGGWLFEGVATTETTEHLLQGAAARAYLTAHGIPPDAILGGDTSRTTLASIRAARLEGTVPLVLLLFLPNSLSGDQPVDPAVEGQDVELALGILAEGRDVQLGGFAQLDQLTACDELAVLVTKAPDAAALVRELLVAALDVDDRQTARA